MVLFSEMHGPIGDGEQGLTGSQRFDDKELEELLAGTLQTEPLDAEVQEYVRLFKEVATEVRADDMRFRPTHVIALQIYRELQKRRSQIEGLYEGRAVMLESGRQFFSYPYARPNEADTTTVPDGWSLHAEVDQLFALTISLGNDNKVIMPAMHLSHPFFVTMDNERLELEGVVRLFVGFNDQPSGLRKGVKVEPNMLDVES